MAGNKSPTTQARTKGNFSIDRMSQLTGRIVSAYPNFVKCIWRNDRAYSYPIPEAKDGSQWHTAIITEELGANWHSIYAYPIAAVRYVGIDTPVILPQVVAYPFIMCYAGLSNYSIIVMKKKQNRDGKIRTHSISPRRTRRNYILRPVSWLAYVADIPLTIVATPIGWLVDAIYEPLHN